MSIVVWDGKTLAADKQVTSGELAKTGTKIRRLKNGEIVAFTDCVENGLLLMKWYENGAKVEDWPEFQKDKEDWSTLIVARNGACFYYQQQPEPQMVEDHFAAGGSGRDFAYGALATGADARKAVEIASRFNVHCGMGIDAFDLREE